MKVVCDMESTGFKHWWHDLISVGLVVLDDSNNVAATFYGQCRPWWNSLEHFNEGSTKAHGFTYYDIQKFQDDSFTLAKKMLHFLAPFRRPGHYTEFINHSQTDIDFWFMQSFFMKCELQFSFYKMFNHSHCVDTIRMARANGHQGNSLPQWASRLNISFRHHNALDDAMVCARIYKYLKENPSAITTTSNGGDSQQAPKLHKQRTRKADTGNLIDSGGGELTFVS